MGEEFTDSATYPLSWNSKGDIYDWYTYVYPTGNINKLEAKQNNSKIYS